MNVKLDMDSTEAILLKRSLNKDGNAQKFFTSEVRRLSDPYVPFRTGVLKNNVYVGTKQIIYKAPYAAKNYYSNVGNGTQGTSRGGLRGKQWVTRMWSNRHSEIVQSVAAFVGGRSR